MLTSQGNQKTPRTSKCVFNLFWLALSGWAGVTHPSFPCVRASGKDTPPKSQPFVIYDVKFQKYFANGVARLAKWQTTPSPETGSLQSLQAMIATMQCLQNHRGTVNRCVNEIRREPF